MASNTSKTSHLLLSLLPDLLGITGTAAVTAGVWLRFGMGEALITCGVILLALAYRMGMVHAATSANSPEAQ